MEPHCPDQVARQFGMVQGIPRAPEYSVNEHQITLRNNDKIRWVQKHGARIAIWDTRLDHIFQGELIVGDSTVPEYQGWYLDRTEIYFSFGRISSSDWSYVQDYS